ncbi:hypothetical protein RvY_10357 [Ramazzottius varieornatus]|uniref:Uncharacterized protein n=1 Tax=Ramazzottius varieornatus TaxID=947166 RepID=A0A1D1VLI8_RAMVA|nr:hypothetical protein RvY_10357 [Ramazzottius varieornatus]
MEVEASTAATATATVTPKADETVQETSPVTKDSSPVPVIQGIKRPASVDTEEDAGERKLVIDEPQDTQVAKEEAAIVDTKKHGTEGQESSQYADGIEAGEIPATTGRGKKGAAANKGTNKRARKETPAQAKTRAVRASRRR